MHLAFFKSETQDQKLAKKLADIEGHEVALFGFDTNEIGAKIHCPDEIGKDDAEALFESLNIPARHATIRGGKIKTARLTKPPKESTPRRIKAKNEVLEIEAFAVCCGGKLISEIESILSTLKRWHPEFPIYLLTDSAGAEIANEWCDSMAFNPNVIIETISAKERAALVDGASIAEKENTSWDTSWIAAKILTMQRAIDRFDCGVLLCDSDITLTRKLNPIQWRADLVLSPIAGAYPDKTGKFTDHFYNAGMVACNSPEIAAEWMALYLSGQGGHYEEGCLSVLARKHRIDHFPTDWNVGRWQYFALPVTKNRTPNAIHVHLDSESKGGNPFEILTLARQYSEEAKAFLSRLDGDPPSCGDEFAVVTSFFNFSDYKRPIQSARRFIRQMESQGVPLYGIELVIEGRKPIFEGLKNWKTVFAKEDALLWQKERLLNSAIKSLPDGIRYVAAIDSDIEFQNPNWKAESIEKFKAGERVFQPFSEMIKTDEDGSTLQTHKATNSKRGKLGFFGNPGFGWAFDRVWFESIGGFYEGCILGGGDTAFANAITGGFKLGLPYLRDVIGEANIEDYEAYCARVFETLAGQTIKPTRGAAVHEWHGSIKNRQYRNRHELIEGFRFSDHIDETQPDFLKWKSDAPSNLKQSVIQYFGSRKEDG